MCCLHHPPLSPARACGSSHDRATVVRALDDDEAADPEDSGVEQVLPGRNYRTMIFLVERIRRAFFEERPDDSYGEPQTDYVCARIFAHSLNVALTSACVKYS